MDNQLRLKVEGILSRGQQYPNPILFFCLKSGAMLCKLFSSVKKIPIPEIEAGILFLNFLAKEEPRAFCH